MSTLWPHAPRSSSPRVLHISPVMFGEDGYWGGGERYPLELARAHAELVPTRMLSFARQPRRERLGSLELRVVPVRHRYRNDDLNPVSRALFREITNADVVHVHQLRTFLTDQALLIGRAVGRDVFVTDHGGWGHNLGRLLPRKHLITGLLAVSRYSADLLRATSRRASVIYGGVDTSRFVPRDGAALRLCSSGGCSRTRGSTC